MMIHNDRSWYRVGFGSQVLEQVMTPGNQWSNGALKGQKTHQLNSLKRCNFLSSGDHWTAEVGDVAATSRRLVRRWSRSWGDSGDGTSGTAGDGHGIGRRSWNRSWRSCSSPSDGGSPCECSSAVMSCSSVWLFSCEVNFTGSKKGL